MTPFAQRSSRSQVATLRPIAMQALAAFDLASPRLKLLNHGFNTIFRVDTSDGLRFALRLGINTLRSQANLRAELAWLTALAAETTLKLPHIVPTRSGEAFQLIPSALVGHDLPAVLFAWLPGRNIDENITNENMQAVGRAMALLHQQARQWVLPAGCALPLVQDVLVGMDNHLATMPNDQVLGHALPDARRELFLQVLAQAQAAQDQLYHEQTPMALHFDLHNWNLKWYRKQLAVFDFDDAAWGMAAQDLTNSWYYLRSRKDSHLFEAAMLAGYSQIAAPPLPKPEILEAMIAGRALLLANDIISNANSDIRSYTPKFFANTEVRLRQYLETGRFDASINWEYEP
jgi:Ser/Thr protein kinase RdoA (MazF antagonist)